MTSKKSFLDKVVDLFSKISEKREKGEKPHSRKRSLQIESLEVREMLSAVGIFSTPDHIYEGQSDVIRLERDDTAGQLTTFFELDWRNSGCYYNNYPGWAENGKDFDFLPGTNSWSYQGHVTFQDGQKYVDIVINAKEDQFLEGDEQISLRLISRDNFWGDWSGVSPNTTYTIDSAKSSTSLIIKDTTTPTTVWVSDVQNGKEGGQNAFVQLERDNVDKELTVYYKLDDRNSGYYYSTNPAGWAKNGTDFNFLPGTSEYNNYGSIKFAAGEKYAKIDFKIINDNWVEGTEQASITLQQQNGCYYGCYGNQGITYYLDADRSAATITIEDDDPVVNVWIEKTQNGTEGGENGYFQLKRDNVERALTVYYRLDDRNSGYYCYYCYYNEPTGWATNGQDFEFLPGTEYWKNYGSITFAAGVDTVNIPVNVIDDTKAEGTENVRITLTQYDEYNGNPGGVTYFLDSGRSTATLSIFDNEAPIVVGIYAVQNATEGGADGYFRLQRSNTQGRLTVYFDLDSRNNGPETAGWAKAGSDFHWLNGTHSTNNHGYVTFQDGQEFVDIQVRAIDDQWIEDTESVSITLNNVKGDGSGETFQVDSGRATATLSIIDNDYPVSVWVEKLQDGAEGGQKGIFRVYRDNADQALTVWFSLDPRNYAQNANTYGWATNGRDFNYLSGTDWYNNRGNVTFAKGALYVDIEVNVIDDERMEGPEQLAIKLEENASGKTYLLDETRRTASLTIEDNEEIIRVWVADVQDGIEGSQNGHVILRRDDTSQELRVWFQIDNRNMTNSNERGWARNGADFEYLPNTGYWSNRGYVTFAAGVSEVKIDIKVIDDAWVEGTEQLSLTLVQEYDYCYYCYYGDEGVKYLLDPATSTATVNIYDNEKQVEVWIENKGDGKEGSHDGYITLKRNTKEGSLTVWFDLDSRNSGCYYNNEGWAKNGVDFKFLPGTDSWNNRGSVTFENGVDTITIPIEVIDDLYIEGDEKIGFKIVQQNDYEPRYLIDAERRETMVTIVDDEQMINVWIGETQNAVEGGQEGYFRIYRDNAYRALDVWFEIDYRNVNSDYYGNNYQGWAKNGLDFEYLPGTSKNTSRGKITFAEGQLYVDVAIKAFADQLYEGPESVRISLVNEDGASGCYYCYYSNGVSFFINPSQREATLTIVDSDSPMNVWVDETKNAVEGAEPGYIRIRRDNADREEVIYYDMDSRNASGFGYEHGGCCYYYGCSYGESYTFGWAKNGYDFQVLPGTTPYSNRGSIKFEAGVYYVDIPIIAYDDGKSEGTELLQISLVSPALGPSASIPYSVDQARKTATVEIKDVNDPAKVWIEKERDAVEGGEAGYFVIRRDNNVGKLVVHYTFDKDASTATWNEDFYQLEGMTPGGARGTIVFEDGVDMIRIPVIAKRDNLVEGTETVVIRLLPGTTNAAKEPLLPPYGVDDNRDSVTINIIDNNSTATVWVDTVQHGYEGGQDGYIRIRRDDATSALRVSYRINGDSTATLGKDYEYLPGTSKDQGQYAFVIFEAGVYYVDIPIRVIDDLEQEPTETVSITLIPGDEAIGGLNAVYEIDQTRASGTVHIYDNDTKPTIWFGEIQHGTEGGANGYVRVYRDITHSDLSVRYIFDAAGSTATMDQDFMRLPGMKDGTNFGTITFKAGEAYVDIPITVIDDRLIEGTETVRLILTTGLGNYDLGDRFEAIVNIHDNDLLTTVKIDSIQNGREGAQDGYIRLYRDQVDRPLTVTFEYDKNASSAVLGKDFNAFPGMMYGSTTGAVTFGIGEHYVDIPIGVIDNAVVDGTRSIFIRLHQGDANDSTSYTVDGSLTATVSIEDNDVLANIHVVSVQDAREGETGHVRIYRDNTSGPLEVKFRFNSTASTATFGDDFTFGGIYDPTTGIGTISFADGQAYIDLAIFALTDFLVEDDETVSITLLDGAGYVFDGEKNAILTIYDTGTEAPVPDAWRVGVVASDPYASENGPNTGEFTIIRTGSSDLSKPLTVRYAVSGSATLGLDYSGINATWDAASQTWIGTITFAAGQTHYILTVTPKQDDLVEGTETVVLTLLPTEETDSEGNPLYAVTSASTATIQIEDAGNIVDPVVDPPAKETFDVSVIATDPYASENGTNSGEFTIVRSGVSDLSKPLTVWFEISGTATINADYTGINATYDSATGKWKGYVIFQANQTHYVLNVVPLQDDLVEGTETVILTLLPTTVSTESGKPVYAVGTNATATIQIEDAQQIADPLTDPPVRETWDINIIATDPFASENGPNSGEFTIVRSGLTDLSQPLTVWFEISGTATINTDYTGINATYDSSTGKWRGFVTFAAGQKYAVINVMPLQDSLTEGTESVVMTLLGTSETTQSGQPKYAVGAAANATVQIEDKTIVPPGTAWISGDPEIREGRNYTIYLHDNDANVKRWEITWGDGTSQSFAGSVTQATHFYADGDENFKITVVSITEIEVDDPTTGWQGLSHGYWKNHTKDWTLYKTTDNYEAVFGVKGSSKPGSLLEALKVQGGGINALWRESVAALMNATHPNIQYRYSVDEIISMVRTAYATGEFDHYKDILETENTREGVDLKNPSSGGGSTGTTREEIRTTMEKDLFVRNVAPDLTISGESKTLPDTQYVLHLSSYDPGLDTITHWTINWGDGTQSVVQGNPSEVMHVYTSVGDYVITATATDEDGTWNSNTVDVRVYEPQTGLVKGTPWISGDPAIYEGRIYTLDLHANEANILRWEITWGDGTTSTVEGTADKATHFYADGDENFTISVVAVKQLTGTTENVTLTKALFVMNVAPTLVISGSSKSEKDKEYLLNLSSYDPGDDTITHWTVNWGDGTVETVSGNPSSWTHIYRDKGTFKITATATDEDGTWNANTVDLVIYVPETGIEKGTPWISGDPEILEGRTYTLDLHANDAIVQQWIITWGDGHSTTIDGSATKATHFYADGDENMTISVVAVKQVDGDTENVTLTKELFVRNVPPTLTISGATKSQPGSIYQLNLSSYDPGDDTITHWIINWGDGIVETVAGNPSSATHIYASEGTYVISGIAVDEDGTWYSNLQNVKVGAGVVETQWIKLTEDNRFVTDFRSTFTIPAGNKALVLETRNLQFDGRSSGMINDAFEVALVDKNGTPLVATIRTTRDGFLNITEGSGAILASGVLYDSGTGRIILDLSKIAVGTEATLIVRLVNNDTDTKTSVELNPNLGFVDSPFGTVPGTTPQENPDNRQAVDFKHLTDVTSMVDFQYGTTTFNDQKGVLRAGLTLTNNSYTSLTGPILVAIKNISNAGVSVTGYDGMTPDGYYYFDVSHFAFSGQDKTFDPEEIIKGLDLQFLNPDHVQFTYDIVVLAHINKAPTFTSEPVTQVNAGNKYVYDAKATDPENDTLRYEKVFGPENMRIDAKTGKITWDTTRGDIGSHNVMIRVYDTYGLYDEQTYTINIVEAVNHPPYFTSTPETEAFVDAIYRYQAAAEDPDGDPLTYRLVSAVRTSDGVSLDTYHATHHLTVTEDGLVLWNPPAELVGKTITVVLEVSDGRGGTALQEYLIAVHADPVNNPPVIISTPPTEYVLPKEGNPALGTVTPGKIDMDLDKGQSRTETISVVLGDYVPMIDVFLLFDDTGSFAGYPPQLAQTLPLLIKQLMTQYPETDFGFGVGRFEDYGYLGEDGNDLPFMLDLPILPTSYENFDDYIKQALNAYHPGSGGDTPESLIEALYQVATGQGFPGFTPSIDYYNGSTPLFGNIGGVGFRPGSIPIILVSGDTGTVYQPDGASYIIGKNGEQIPIDKFLGTSRGSTPDGKGATIQQTIDALNDIGAIVIGLSPNSSPGDSIRQLLEAISLATGSVNSSSETLPNGLSWDPIDPGDPLYYHFSGNANSMAEQIANAVGSCRKNLFFDVVMVASDPRVTVHATPEQINAVLSGEKVFFDVTFTGDDQSYSFDLLLVRAGTESDLSTATVIGRIPVTIKPSYNYTCVAVDPDGDELVYSLIDGPEGASINPQTGVLSWKPTVPGEYTFTVHVTDGRGGEDTQTWTVVVKETDENNTPPTLDTIEDMTLNVGQAISLQLSGHDADGDSLSYYLVNNETAGKRLPEGLTVNRYTGQLNWNPTLADLGTHEITIEVLDGHGGKAIQTFTITVTKDNVYANNKPGITSSPALIAVVGQAYRYDVAAYDPDHDALTFDLVQAPEGMVIDAQSGKLVWTPKDGHVGEQKIVIRVSDGRGGYAYQEYKLNVVSVLNEAPTIISKPEGPIVLNQPWEYQVVATDPNGDALTYAIDAASAARGMTIDENGLVSWTPTQTGKYDVMILVDDGRGGQDIQVFTIEITSVAAPTITSEPQGPAFVGEEWTYLVKTDQDTGTYTLALDADSLSRGMYLDGNTIRWTPNAIGPAPVKLTLTDQYGGKYTQTFTINAQAKPIASYPPSIDSEPAGPVYVGEEWTYQIVTNDPAGYDVTIYVMDENGIPVQTLTDGVLRWTPSDTSSKKFIIRAENEHGAWREQTFTINPVAKPVKNDAPEITSLPLGPTMVGENYQYQVNAYDPDGDALTYAVDTDSFDKGVRIDKNGLLTWTPDVAGMQTITITVTDSFGNSRTQTFDLKVDPRPIVSQAPVITSQPAGPVYVGEQWSYTIVAHDPDNDAFTLWLVDADGNKIEQIDLLTNTITWTPDAAGERAFYILAEDIHGFGSIQYFTIKAVEVPVDVESPRISSVPTGRTFVDERYEYQVTAQVFDGSAPTFSIDQTSYDLGVRIDRFGKLTWIPGTEGTYTIRVTVTDGSGKSAWQEFDLNTVQRPVILVPPTITSKPTGPAYVGEEWTYQLSGHATDGTAVDFYLVDNQGNVIRKIENGLLAETYGAEGTQKLIVRAVDSRGASIDQEITLSVVNRVIVTNDPPVVYSIPVEQTRLENLYQYKVKAYDPNGDPLTYSLGKAPHGATISKDGVLSWNPSMTGEYEFTILVSDGVNDPVEHSFKLTVLPPVTINTPPQITSVPLTSTMKDREYQYQAKATDLDGDTITWHLDDLAIPEAARGNISIDQHTGLLTWTPTVAGTFTFTVAAFDGTDFAEQIVTLYVADNAPPVITGLPGPNVEFGHEYTSQVVAHDPNGDEITFRLENAPTGLTIGADGTLTWETPVLGRHNITVVVTDVHGASARRQFQLNVVNPAVPNEAPTLVGSLPGSIPVKTPFTYQLGATDPENDPVTFRLVEGPAGMTISSSGRIEWTPTATGEVSFKVELSDGQNLVVYTCSLGVVAQRENHPPVFTSTSATSITVNKQYTYKPTAMDPDGDSVTITLIGGPSGLKMNEQGDIVWTPGSAWAGQKVTYTLRATDAYGMSVDQVVELSVRSVILAPTMVMEQLPVGKIGQEWSYQVKATDPQGEKVKFVLVEGPAGMTINEKTGVVTYTPTELPEAPYYVIWFKVKAVNDSGVASNNGVFPLQVDPNSAYNPGDPGGPGTPGGYNNPPKLTLPQSHYIEAGKQWSHQLIASDPDGDTLTFKLNNPPSGMTINTATGLISWLPGTGIVGNQYEISVTVSDGQASQTGSFWLGIEAPNNKPVIKAIPTQTVTAGAKFQYYASATDADRNDVLSFSLDADSITRGLQINAQNGLISWTPGTERAGQTLNVTVFVTDGRDEPVSTTFALKVVQDTIAPTVTIVATPSKTAAGEKVTIQVYATDNVGVKTTTLQLKSIKDVNGNVREVNKTIELVNGKAVYTLDANEYGTLTFVATAVDAQGNRGTSSTTVQAIDPRDTEAPKVAISSLGQGAKIYGPVDIVGTVTDNEPGVSWTLKAIAMDNGKEVLIAEGTGNIENSVLGRFDTTILRNGTWQIVLEAVDVGGNKSEKYLNVEVEGSYKLGNFNMSFTDFDLQLSGLPITITRKYDTLNADQKGDFGYGWTLDIIQYKLMIDYGNGLQEPNPYQGLSNGDILYFVLPDGTKEGFVFNAKPITVGYWQNPNFCNPVFTPLAGTKSKILYDGSHELLSIGGGYEDSSGLGYEYTPFNGFFGGVSIQLRNGTILNFDSGNGVLTSAKDMSGNMLYFHENGIEHSSGKKVVFERDNQGRITSIVGPDGKKVTYGYDAKGNLISVTDKSGATTQFTYLEGVSDPEHYLDRVIDPLGRPVAKTEFDNQGRIKKVIDADGKTTEYGFDSESGIQWITDQLGNTKTVYTDTRGNVIKEVSPEGAITLKSYDSQGRVLAETKVIKRDGYPDVSLTTAYAYTAEGYLAEKTDSRGNVSTYTYDKYGQVTSMTSNGHTITMRYDDKTGLPLSTTDIYGNTTSFAYDSRGNLTALKNSNGVVYTNNTYNQFGEVTSSTNILGRTTYMDYDNNGDCIETYYIENGQKILTRTSYDEMRRVVGQSRYVLPVSMPFGKTINDYKLWETKIEYNAAGQVTSVVDQDGLTTEYRYDVRGFQTEVRSQSRGSDGGIVTSIQRIVYDELGRCIYQTDRFVEGTPLTSIQGSHTIYDKDGRAVGSERLSGVDIRIADNGKSVLFAPGMVISSSSAVYNNAGWLVSTFDTNKLETRYVYNAYGDITQLRQELIDGNWMVSETVYDNKGRVVFSTDAHVEGSGDPVFGSKTIFDEQGRVVGSERYKGVKINIAVDGSTAVQNYGTKLYGTSTVYDSKGCVGNSTDAEGNTTRYEYDNLDRLVRTFQSNGLVTETAYNAVGQISEVRIVNGAEIRTTKYEYDLFGNVVKTTQPDGTTIKAEYNNKGQKISETNQAGQVRTFEYDVAGRIICVTMPGGAKYTYEYDAKGNQTLIRDPNGHETRFTYDENGRMLTRTLPLGFGEDGQQGTADDRFAADFSEQFEYDKFGRTTLHVSFEGAVTKYVYDNYGRLATKSAFKDMTAYLSNTASETWAYEYDSQGRTTKVTQQKVGEAARSTITRYNAESQIESISTPEGKISYEYDKFGRQTKVTLDTGETTYYTYDRYGRLATVSADGKTTRYEYDAYGNLAQTIMPNGVITTYVYDCMNRLTKLTNWIDKNNDGKFSEDEGEGISDYDYTLDGLGRKTHASENFWTEFGKKTNSIDWLYDDMGRLTREVFDHWDGDQYDQTSDWIYDLVGNRLQQTVNGKVTKYDYDANDRLLSETTEGKKTDYGYDHTQQTRKVVTKNGVIISESTFTYDVQGRMETVTVRSGDRMEFTRYAYGTDGIRTSAEHEVWENGELKTKTRTEYVNDRLSITGYSQVLKQTETDQLTGTQTVTTYVIGHQRISQTVETNGEKTTYFFTYDGHGSTRVLTDLAGAVAKLNGTNQVFHYDAYGNAIGFDPKLAATEFLYSGEQFDSRIGMQYLRARYYDPATGRFNRLDPFFGKMSDPQSLHKYLYAHGDPVNMNDPTGLFGGMAGVSMSIGIGMGMDSMSARGVMAAGAVAGGTAGLLVGGYSGYLQGLMAYDFDEQQSMISSFLWGLVGAAAGSAPGLKGLGYNGAAGFGLGALQGSVDSALGFNDPISAAMDGLASALIGLGIGTVGDLLGGSGIACKVVSKCPWLAPVGGAAIAAAGTYMGVSGVIDSMNNGNPEQAFFRGIFALTDIYAVMKMFPICFTEETPILQYGKEYFSEQVAMMTSSENANDKRLTPYLTYGGAGLIASAYIGMQIAKTQNCASNVETKKRRLQELRRRLAIAELDFLY